MAPAIKIAISFFIHAERCVARDVPKKERPVAGRCRPVRQGRYGMAKKREPNGVEPDFTEDDIQREQFGPRGVPGAPDPAKMTPQREKKTPKHIDQGHTS